MRKTIASFVSLMMLGLLTGLPAHADFINANIYTGFTASGGGAPYSNLAGSVTANDVLFGTDNNWHWNPFSLADFGADITGGLQVATSGSYTFQLRSDDGSLLFIDGLEVINNGGGHPPTTLGGSTFLKAGEHNFEIQFFEDYGGDSGVDLYLPTSGVTYTNDPPASTPEPPACALLLTGLALLALLWWEAWFACERVTLPGARPDCAV